MDELPEVVDQFAFVPDILFLTENSLFHYAVRIAIFGKKSNPFLPKRPFLIID